jgi:hypothetical protein
MPRLSNPGPVRRERKMLDRLESVPINRKRRARGRSLKTMGLSPREKRENVGRRKR